MDDLQTDIRLIHLLLTRLERISADSHWARRASGTRGSLLRLMERQEAGAAISPEEASELIQAGFDILEQAAREKRGI